MTTAVGTLPNTFLVGAPKSGTTYLASWLGTAQDVFVPQVKEPGFFMEAHHYGRGLDHYASRYYGTARDEKVVIDATPWYLYPASVPARISESIGTSATRIVIVLREPVARAVSMYYDQFGRRREERTMAEAFADDLAVVDPEAELAGEAGPDLFRHYVLCGRYAGPIGRYIAEFGRESVCVLLAEDLWCDPASAKARLESFLGVALPDAPERPANPSSRAQFGLVEHLLSKAEDSRSPIRGLVARFPTAAGTARLAMDAVARWNQRPVEYETPDPALRQALHEWFAPSNRALAELIGADSIGDSLEAWA